MVNFLLLNYYKILSSMVIKFVAHPDTCQAQPEYFCESFSIHLVHHLSKQKVLR